MPQVPEAGDERDGTSGQRLHGQGLHRRPRRRQMPPLSPRPENHLRHLREGEEGHSRRWGEFWGKVVAVTNGVSLGEGRHSRRWGESQGRSS